MQLKEFKNQEFIDFTSDANQNRMKEAIALVRSKLGREYPILIGGEQVTTERKFESLNPSRQEEVVGVFQAGTPELVERAMSVARQAFQQWSRTSAEERVEKVLKVSAKLQERRFEMAAWMVVEVGKSWAEADGDIAEAIDFIEFYAREMLRLAGPQPVVPLAGEENELRYIPLGVGAIIPPWNFPMAILTGMSMAAVVSGNCVIIKPSSDSPAVAAQFIEVCQEAGFPPGVVNFLSGSGSIVGEGLVVHPQTRFISFTGSMQVGLRINELAAKTVPGQIWIKRVVAEMGGKDAIIVDDETDVDEAASGVAAAAFGFQGQKCSACSRAIVVDSVYDDFLTKLKKSTADTVIEGNVEEGANFGPVINAGAQRKILEYIEIGRQEGRLIQGGEAGDPRGFNVQPTILADIAPEARTSQEEIFGPVLAVTRARDFDHALEIANGTIYGLTGAVYSNNPEKLERARHEFHVGNLYMNRKCTGALVGVHPFGGFNMSGTDSKAGGRDYLLLFTQAKAISQKV